MNFTLLNWSAVVAGLLITLLFGLYFRLRLSRSVDDYFVSGRKAAAYGVMDGGSSDGTGDATADTI